MYPEQEKMMSSLNSDEHDVDFFRLDPLEEAGADFVAHLGEQLQMAFIKQKRESKLTYQELAEKMHVNRAGVHRCFSGSANLTAEKIGQLGRALGGRAEVAFIFDDHPQTVGRNDFIDSDYSNEEEGKTSEKRRVVTANEAVNAPTPWAMSSY